MPTYEYACTSCGNTWEEFQKITEPPVEVCPQCNARSAKRQVSGGTFILKGGGWYADLYSSSKPAAKSGSNGAGPSTGASSDGGSGSAASTTAASSTGGSSPAGGSSSGGSSSGTSS